MGGVVAQNTAAVGTQLLHGHLTGLGIQGQHLLGDDLCVLHSLAVYRDGSGIHIDFRVRQIIPLGIRRNGFYQIHILIAAQGLGHALLGKNQGAHQTDGEQNVQGAAHQILPEIAHAVLLNSGQTPDQAPQHRNAAGGGDEVLYRQTHGLGEIAQGDLAGIGLPVGVGGETGGGVKGQMPA